MFDSPKFCSKYDTDNNSFIWLNNYIYKYKFQYLMHDIN